eukprot:TRINITY_DN105717_c0_g1_i1.p1 TRINITY_DN105717_c0_g1~~TRINITY_DN105717_c0_g1_i1.p1  ORF type:complete len:319 (+),score=64.74 TRINITY_DN105717_c0_g1_i1:40-957(+)
MASARARSPGVRAEPKGEGAAAEEEKKDEEEKETVVPSIPNEQPDKAGASWCLLLRRIAIFAGVAALLYCASAALGDKKKLQDMLESALAYVEDQGNTAVLVYMALTLVGVVCLVPTTIMELAGGFVFSPRYGVWGVLLFTGSAKLVANVVSVLIARHLVKDWVNDNIVAKSDLLKMVSKAVKEEPWKMAFLVRGSMAPLFVKNYGLGVMDIGYLPIACFSMIFTNFYALQNIYMGSICQDLKEVFSPKKAAAASSDWVTTIKRATPVVFNVLLFVFLVRAVKAQLKKQKDAIQASLEAKEDKQS